VLAGRFPSRDGKILWKVEELLSRVVAETSSPGGGSGAAHDDGQQQLEDDDDDWVELEILTWR
jgi:hypothetical protein